MSQENNIEISVITKREWELVDGSSVINAQIVMVPAGRYLVERVTNPFRPDKPESEWLVLKGTMVGQSEGAWRQWEKGALNAAGQPIDWGDFEVVIEEKPVNIP